MYDETQLIYIQIEDHDLLVRSTIKIRRKDKVFDKLRNSNVENASEDLFRSKIFVFPYIFIIFCMFQI